jgi:hypothetical protein
MTDLHSSFLKQVNFITAFSSNFRHTDRIILKIWYNMIAFKIYGITGLWKIKLLGVLNVLGVLVALGVLGLLGVLGVHAIHTVYLPVTSIVAKDQFLAFTSFS